MQTASDMSKDQTFRLRLDAEDRKRLDLIAAHYSATASTAVRILIKEKADWLATRWAEPMLTDELYARVLRAYLARCEREGHIADQPDELLTTVDKSGLITLRNGRGELARYRVRDEKLVYVK